MFQLYYLLLRFLSTPPAAITNYALDSGGNLATFAGTVASSKIAVSGGLTNNHAPPTTTNVGVLSQLANATAPTWTKGDQGLKSTDLKGNLRTKQCGGSLSVGQVFVANTATLILGANANRMRLIIIQTGTTAVYIGGSGVATNTGQYMVGIAGYPISIRTTAAVYGIVSTGTQTVTYMEETAS